MADKMFAVRKTKKEPGLECTETEVPKIGDEDVLVKIKACSICGTDIHIYDWEAPWDKKIEPPMTIGHEGCGEVVEVGKKIASLEVGDFVSAESHFHCGRCDMCKLGNPHVCRNMKALGMGGADGTYAEYLRVPVKSAWKTSKDIPPEIATLQEPLGNAVYTVEEGNVGGKTVAVFGGGPIGLFSVGVAKVLGAVKIIIVTGSQIHLDLAKKMGADVLVNRHEEDPVKRIMEETDDKGVDVMLEMTGAQKAIEQGFTALRPSGKAVLLGLSTKPVTIDWSNLMVLKDLEVKGIYGRRLFQTWQTTTNLLSSGKLDIKPMITHKFKLEEFEKGIGVMRAKECGKVVMFPG